MPEQEEIRRIFISAAEPSADALCAALITALKKTGKNFEFIGLGGAKMADEGCQILEKTTDKAAMAYNAFSNVLHFWKILRGVKTFLKNNKTDIVIVCDSPAFNFHVAKAAKKLNIQTVFYVAPQLWAWAPWRISKLRKYCDKLICILPFEEEWFKTRGVDAVYVSHPLLDELIPEAIQYKKDYSTFEPKNLKLLLLPGSRKAEIDALWKPMQQIALQLKRKYQGLKVTTAAVDEKTRQLLRNRHTVGFVCNYVIGSLAEAAQHADFAIVASGTATLQVAAVGCPMVVMYQSSKLMWHLLGRWLIKTKYLSLVNILAGKDLVPEFMPYFDSIDPIVQSIDSLLQDKNKLSRLSSDLIDLTAPLHRESASVKTAEIITRLLDVKNISV
jgi:lipid-A-disaccharide synthase